MHHTNRTPLSYSPFRRRLVAFTALLLVVAAPARSFALSDLLVGSFIDDGISALSRGGLQQLPQRQEGLDFSSPLLLDSQGKFRSDTSYEHQRTIRIYKGKWSGTHAYSDRLETSVAAPFSLFAGRLKGSAAAGYGNRSVELEADNSSQGLQLASRQRVEGPKGGIYLDVLDRFRLGVAAVATNLREGIAVPVEAEAAPLPFLKIGYRRSYVDFATTVTASLSGHSGRLPLEDLEEINECYAVVDHKVVYLKYANEMEKTGNRRVEGRVNLPASFYLVGSYATRDLPQIDEDFSVDGNQGGTFHGRFRKSLYRAGIGAELGGKWSVEANYRHGDFSTEGGGVASTTAVASFWPSLLLGNYNYLYFASLASDQYHLATAYRGERFSFGLGMQYLDLRPKAGVDYWRNVIFGLGRTGGGTLGLTIDRVELLFLSFGLGYSWQNVALSYAFGQFIPLEVHDRKSPGGSAPSSASGGGGGGGKDFFSRVGDSITHNPGGNLQRLMLSITF